MDDRVKALKKSVKKAIEVVTQELKLREDREKIPNNFLNKARRVTASTEIKVFRKRNSELYPEKAKVADPVAYCKQTCLTLKEAADALATTALRLNLDDWLHSNCKSLAQDPVGEAKEQSRRTAQRRLLIDAMMEVAGPEALKDKKKRETLLSQLAERIGPSQNVTWCQASDWV